MNPSFSHNISRLRQICRYVVNEAVTNAQPDLGLPLSCGTESRLLKAAQSSHHRETQHKPDLNTHVNTFALGLLFTCVWLCSPSVVEFAPPSGFAAPSSGFAPPSSGFVPPFSSFLPFSTGFVPFPSTFPNKSILPPPQSQPSSSHLKHTCTPNFSHHTPRAQSISSTC
jgi:hypothetical protein